MKTTNLTALFPISLAAALALGSPAIVAAAPDAKGPAAKLVAVLSSSASQKEKADACRELAHLNAPEAVAPLAALLADPQLSHMARYALETMPGSGVDKALREALGKLSGRPLAGAANSVGVRRDTKAVKPLTALLRYSDPDVAQASARALGRIATSAAANALEEALPATLPVNRPAFCEGLLRCADALAAGGHRRQALAIYDQLRVETTPPPARIAAWRGAILVRQHDGLPLLLQAFRSEDRMLASAAARIAIEMPDAAVTPALAAEMAQPPVDRQVLLIQVLARRADPAALPALLSAARSGEIPVRVAALRALPEFPTPAGSKSASAKTDPCLPALFELIGDPNPQVAQAAQETLAAQPAADAAILAMLNRDEESRRLMAMDLVVRRRMLSAVPDLFKATADANPKVRLAAIRRLGELAPPKEAASLLDVLARAKTPEELEAAEQAVIAVSLRAAQPDTSAELLSGRLPQATPAQKCALLRSLAAVGGVKALRSVRAAVDVPDQEVHAAAIRALGAWNSPEAAPDLLELARNASNPTDKMLCLRSYLHFASGSELSADQRLDMCRKAAPLVQKEEEKKLLLAALGGIHEPGSLGLIQPYLDEPALQQEAATAIANAAEQLLKGNNAARNAATLIPLLEKVVQAAPDSAPGKRAAKLLESARKAGQ